MADKAEAVYLDEMGNVVPRERARRVRITLTAGDGRPAREIWGAIYRPDDAAQWWPAETDYDVWR
jgi:hypothetical protein